MASREELELQYSPSRWSHRLGPNEVIPAHVKALTEGSELAKSTVECELGFPYGLSENEKLDIFGANTLPSEAPIFVYIHGGYWQDLNREMSSFMVLPLTSAGAVVVVIGYDLAPKASLDEIVRQVKKGVAFVLNMAKRRGSSGVYLCGHSAGGQLAAMMLAQDWMNECMVSNSLIKGAVLVSGVYDLRPLVNTYVNDALKMTEEDALRNSPVNCQDVIIERSRQRKLLVVVGEHDPPEYKRQSIAFNTSLLGGGVQSIFMQIGDTDHFNVIDNLRQEDYTLTKEILRLMGLYLDPLIEGMQSAGLS